MAAKFLTSPKARMKKNSTGKDTIESAGEKAETPSDKITRDNNNFLSRASNQLDPVAVERAERLRAISKKAAQRNRELKDEKREELLEMQSAGFFPAPDEVKKLSTEDRRREVFKLHLRGYDQTLMSEIFGVHRQTIVSDMKLVRQKLVAELTTLGAEGLVTQSFSMYELLQHEAMKRIDLLPATAVKQVAPLLRLAKDLEDSKVKLLSTIGALKPKMIEGAERIAKGDKVVAPEVRTGDLMRVLSRVSERYQNEIDNAEDAELVDNDE
ncbi:coil containing protein [Vibrio phage vB_ValS_PJ32]|nr:coil containing protein [Vibrio phage vB_ValS_PJ32]